MKACKEKIKLSMARACMNPADLIAATEMPAPTVKNVLAGRSVRPATLGRIAKALKIDPSELLEQKEVQLCNIQ